MFQSYHFIHLHSVAIISAAVSCTRRSLAFHATKLLSMLTPLSRSLAPHLQLGSSVLFGEPRCMEAKTHQNIVDWQQRRMVWKWMLVAIGTKRIVFQPNPPACNHKYYVLPGSCNTISCMMVSRIMRTTCSICWWHESRAGTYASSDLAGFCHEYSQNCLIGSKLTVPLKYRLHMSP